MSGFPPPPPPPSLGGDSFASPYGAGRPAPAPASQPAAVSPAPGSEATKPPPAAVLGRPDDDRTRGLNTAAFPGPFAAQGPVVPAGKRDAHVAAAEQGAAAFRQQQQQSQQQSQQPGQQGSVYREPLTASSSSTSAAAYPADGGWAAGERERESQDRRAAEREQRDKGKRMQIEVLNRPAFAPSSSPDVKAEPQGQHAPPPPAQAHSNGHLSSAHQPPPTSSIRGGGPAPTSARGRHHNKGPRPGALLAADLPAPAPSTAAFAPSMPGARTELEPAALASAPNPSVRTPFLPSTLARQAPPLGRFVYGGPRWLLPADVGRKGAELAQAPGPGLPNGPGGKVVVVVPAGYLGSGWALKQPTDADDNNAAAASAAAAARSAGWKTLLAAVNLERRVWGTEVYTDDSDLVGVLVHSGWLVPAADGPPSSATTAAGADDGKRKRAPSALAGAGAALKVELRVVGRLLRFVGTDRHGVKSRGWGNGHDGASVVVEHVSVIQAERPPTLSRRTKRPRTAQLQQMRAELADAGALETISLNVLGGAGYRYSPAALAEAMELSEIEPPDDDDDLPSAGGGEPTYTKVRPDLLDADLLLENAEERYRIRPAPGPASSGVVEIRIFPRAAAPAEDGGGGEEEGEDEGEPLGGGLIMQRDLEWVEGGLIVRESPLPDGFALAPPAHQDQQQQALQPAALGGQRGWFCKVSRWWWEPRPAGRLAAAGADGGRALAGPSTIPGWVAAGADKAAAAAGASDGEAKAEDARAPEAAVDVSMDG